MRQRGFAVIDFETTGLSPARGDRAIEIAVVHATPDGQITGEWETLIRVDRDLGRQDIHRITPADIEEAPRFEQIAADLADLLDGRVVVAHNAGFDLRFLQAEYAEIGYRIPVGPATSLCTMQIGRRLGLRPATLAACCDTFDIPLVDAHRASADTRATAELLGAYIASMPDDRTWADALDAAAGQRWPRINVDAAEWMPRRASEVTARVANSAATLWPPSTPT